MASMFKPWTWLSSATTHQVAETLVPEPENNPEHIEDDQHDAQGMASNRRMANLEATTQDSQDQLGDVQTRMQDVTTDVASVRDLLRCYYEELREEFRHLRTSVSTNAQSHDATHDAFANDVERQLSVEQQERSSRTLSASPETDHAQPETKTPSKRRKRSSTGPPTEPVEPPTPGGRRRPGRPRKNPEPVEPPTPGRRRKPGRPTKDPVSDTHKAKGSKKVSEPPRQRQPLQELSGNIAGPRSATTSQAKEHTNPASDTIVVMSGANREAEVERDGDSETAPATALATAPAADPAAGPRRTARVPKLTEKAR